MKIKESDGKLQITVNSCESMWAGDLEYYTGPERVSNVKVTAHTTIECLRRKIKVYRNFTVPKGLAMIIHNYDFGNHCREGSEIDEYNIRQLLVKLGYNVLDTRKDRSAQVCSCSMTINSTHVYRIFVRNVSAGPRISSEIGT